jgi:hypothetical protein
VAHAQYSGTGTFGKITSLDDLSADSYYVLYGINGDDTGAMGSSLSGGRYGAVDVTMTGGNIVDPTSVIVWELKGNATDGYTLKNEDSGKFCEITQNKTSGFAALETSGDGFDISYTDAKGFFISSKNSESGGRGISIYKTDFRPYTSSSVKVLHLYKMGHVPPPPTGTLEITSPNGGESYNAGQEVQIQWNSTDVSSVYFELSSNNGADWMKLTGNMESVDGANTYDYTIPANTWGGDQYKIRILDEATATIIDECDAAFTVVGHDVNLFYEDFGDNTLAKFEQVSTSGSKVWEADNYSGKTFAKMSGYQDGVNEDWLISSAINLDNSTNEILEFKTSCNFSGDDIVVKYSTDYDGQGDPSTATWQDFTGYTLSSGSYNWTHSGYLELNAISGNMRIAFVYTCTADKAKTWQVSDVFVSGVEDTSTDVDAPKVAKMEVGPNPFVNEFEIKTPKTVVDVVMYNTAGQVVKNDRSGSKLVNTANLSNGMYVLQVKFADGSTITQKVIKK